MIAWKYWEQKKFLYLEWASTFRNQVWDYKMAIHVTAFSPNKYT